jgi:uncharacterized protein
MTYHTDLDGRLHVASTPISRAGITRHYGREIPNFKEKNLEAGKVYRLLRPAEELAEAAHYFRGVPVLACHVPTAGVALDAGLVIGACGTKTKYLDPFLVSDLILWSGGAIDDVRNGARRELSAGYHYRADMTPGVWNGQKYDGVMRNISPHHVALVERSRVDGMTLPALRAA